MIALTTRWKLLGLSRSSSKPVSHRKNLCRYFMFAIHSVIQKTRIPIWKRTNDIDNDNDHSYSHLPVTKRWLVRKGQSAWVVISPCLTKKKTYSIQDKLNNVFRSDLLSLEAKSAFCALKELRCTRGECVVRNPGRYCLDEYPCCICLRYVEDQLSICWKWMSRISSSSLVSSSF